MARGNNLGKIMLQILNIYLLANFESKWNSERNVSSETPSVVLSAPHALEESITESVSTTQITVLINIANGVPTFWVI